MITGKGPSTDTRSSTSAKAPSGAVRIDDYIRFSTQPAGWLARGRT